jgi:hypothetical protein
VIHNFFFFFKLIKKKKEESPCVANASNILFVLQAKGRAFVDGVVHGTNTAGPPARAASSQEWLLYSSRTRPLKNKETKLSEACTNQRKRKKSFC